MYGQQTASGACSDVAVIYSRWNDLFGTCPIASLVHIAESRSVTCRSRERSKTRWKISPLGGRGRDPSTGLHIHLI